MRFAMTAVGLACAELGDVTDSLALETIGVCLLVLWVPAIWFQIGRRSAA